MVAAAQAACRFVFCKFRIPLHFQRKIFVFTQQTMGRRKKGKREATEEVKEASDTATLPTSSSDLNSENGKDFVQIRQLVDSEIRVHLSAISELRGKVTVLQNRRVELENGILGELDSALSIKDQWKVIKKLKNEENKAIFEFIDNVRKDSEQQGKKVKEVERVVVNLQSEMAEKHSKGTLFRNLASSIYSCVFI